MLVRVEGRGGLKRALVDDEDVARLRVDCHPSGGRTHRHCAQEASPLGVQHAHAVISFIYDEDVASAISHRSHTGPDAHIDGA